MRRDERRLLQGRTVTEALWALAETAPETATVFPGQGTTVSAAELARTVRSTARGLLRAGVRPGEVVGVIASAGTQLVTGVFAVMAAGAAVSVLPSPQVVGDSGRSMRRIAGIGAGGLSHLVIDSENADLVDRLAGLGVMARVHRLPLAGGEHPGSLPEVDEDDLAVVQYTSGSLARPRGVILTHRAVMSGLRSIVDSAELTTGDVLVQWVPHHHDMGLFGHLAQFLNGGAVHVFSPSAFLRDPRGYLEYFGHHRGTLTTGPNFSYDLLAQAVSEGGPGPDLSRWRLAFNGAEPVSARTVQRFDRAFAAFGVESGVMYPVYGLAEATLPVTFPPPGAPARIIDVDRDELATAGRVRRVTGDDPRAKQLVSVGRAVAGASIRLVDDDGRPLGAGRLGEIQIRGPMVTTEYLGDPEATEALFDRGWLRTGDLAVRVDDDYFIAGRRKEMLILHGQNYFPDDIEVIVRPTPGIYRAHCVAVAETVSAPDGCDRDDIAVIAETTLRDAAAAELAETIERRVTRELGFPHVRVHLVEPHWLTRTTSGKWQRRLAARRLRPADRR
ncbi:AMP-binding protein [Nocardia sp. NPDC004068]|uniref:AMP-binding protein n=1 Tax=Nocardia sp. NPDC004068 TaxID=3364303 RepID=UPI00368D487C